MRSGKVFLGALDRRIGWVAALLCSLLVSGVLGTAQAQLSGDDRRCVFGLGRDLRRVIGSQGRNINDCIRDAGREALGDESVENCLNADRSGRVARAIRRTEQNAGRNCVRSPDFAATDVKTLSALATSVQNSILMDLLGIDLDAGVLLKSEDPEGVRCQRAVIKAFRRCQDARLKAFSTCKRQGIASGAISDAASLIEVCDPKNIPDPFGKVARACRAKLNSDVLHRCLTVDQARTVPGCPEGFLGDCVSEIVACRTCAAISAANELPGYPCEGCGIGPSICDADLNAFCESGPFEGEPCTDAILNRDCDAPACRDPNLPGECIKGECLALSNTILYIANPILERATRFFDLPSTSTRALKCEPPGPDGVATCICPSIRPSILDLGFPLGVACISPLPPGSCTPGKIDCDGGALFDTETRAFHTIGFCGLGDDPNEPDPSKLRGRPDCLAMCEAHCASLPGGDFRMLKGGCEGYCNGGPLNGALCVNDTDCCLGRDCQGAPSGGECTGPDPLKSTHAKQCNCECIAAGVRPTPARPGAFFCEMGVRAAVEASEGQPEIQCKGLLPPSTIAESCNPVTTETMSLIAFDALLKGFTMEPPGDTGEPISCSRIGAGYMTGLRLVGQSTNFDTAAGDLAQPTAFVCK
ncbi:MAG: hypothetical protein ACE5FG_10670 [Myxococcota bacterium]